MRTQHDAIAQVKTDWKRLIGYLDGMLVNADVEKDEAEVASITEAANNLRERCALCFDGMGIQVEVSENRGQKKTDSRQN
ncbi:hypothetical protein [Pantoea sp. A4]|uniref:hypothetical protein n=1 Tax=Pantoea sp. A4 TaxID=1225184 RepID=UPI000367A780|nr:hypothetical protein [Pantoea sp. A4]